MLRLAITITAAILLAALSGCDSGRHSSAGFRLPEIGDIERGKAAFVALKCNECHAVPGTNLAPPTVEPAVPVALGGYVSKELTDGYLVASIINPSFKLAGYRRDLTATADGKSRMPQYTDITAQQLSDIVAFLQSRYKVLPKAHELRF